MRIKKLYKALISFVVTFVLIAVVVLSVNFYVIFSQNKNILSTDDIAEKTQIAHIMVLGCGINGDKPSDMLEDRLITALEIAERLPQSKLILTGNNSGESYNEVGVMKNYCIENGFDEERIICDDYGFSTGESVTNLSETFGVEKVIIVTQRYHLYRALHIASQYDIEAYGVSSAIRQYTMQIYYSIREIAARNKDFIKFFFI